MKNIKVTLNQGGKLENLISHYRQNIHQLNEYIPTNIKALDKIIGGLCPGELIIVGARPIVGKTTFLLNIAKNISVEASNKTASLFINLESDLQYSIQTMLKILSESTNTDGIHSESEIKKVLTEIKDSPLYFLGQERNLESLITKILKYITEEHVKVIFIDNIQLLSFSHKSYRDLELGNIILSLKQIAKEHNVTIVLSSQLNRNAEYRGGDMRPRLSDLRDSGSLEQEADKVILISRPEVYRIDVDCDGNSLRDIAEIIVAKNRYGKTGEAMIAFKRQCLFSVCKKTT